MITDIIISRLNEIIECMKSFDAKRGTFKYSDIEQDFRATKIFFGNEHKFDFGYAERMINDKYGSYKIFDAGYKEMMSGSVDKLEQIDCVSKIIAAVSKCDNFCLLRRDDDTFFALDYFDEKSFYDEEYLTKKDGTTFYYVPDLNDWKTAKFAKDEDDTIFYTYSYYIILLAKLVSETVNSCHPFRIKTDEDRTKAIEQKKRSKLESRSLHAQRYIDKSIKDHLSVKDYTMLSTYVTAYIIGYEMSKVNAYKISDIGELTVEDIFTFSNTLHMNFIKDQAHRKKKEQALASIRMLKKVFKVLDSWEVDPIYSNWANRGKSSKHIKINRLDDDID